MTNSVRGIDHVVVLVHDLDDAQARFQSLGFTVTPRAYHPWGTANHLVQFGRSFIEIVGIAKPDKLVPHTEKLFSFSAHAADILARRQGMAMIVFSSADAEADTANWARSGLRTYEPVYFERGAKLPGGEQAKVAFTVSFVTHAELPDCAFFVCQQHFPQYFWKAEYQRHANGAVEIGRATLSVASEPQRLADFVHHLTGFEPTPAPGGIEVNMTWGAVEVLTREACTAHYPLLAGEQTAPEDNFVNLAIDVADIGKAAKILEGSGVPYRAAPTYIDIAPESLFGLGMRIGQT